MAKTEIKSSTITQIKIIVLAIIVWSIITAWDDFIDKYLYDILKLKRTVWSALKIAVIVTIVGLLILYFSNVRFHTIVGVNMAEIK